MSGTQFWIGERVRMSDTRSGTAVPPADLTHFDRTHMICIGLILALAVGSMAVLVNAGNNPGDPDLGVLAHTDTGLVPTGGIEVSSTGVEIDAVVAESDCGCLGPFDTEQGWIEIDRYNIPDELALCIDSEYLAQWYVDVWVYGGYKPWTTGSYIEVYQKGEMVGVINVSWTWVEKGECCVYDRWEATFWLDDPICLESNQYPDVAPWCIDWPDGQDTIPGKEVYMRAYTFWTGCTPGEEPSQDFTIIRFTFVSGTLKIETLSLQFARCDETKR
ncbi:MAG: hypothetical protein DRP09_11785 [Candidatus Thorarchaeota archaeon]|nr:MAG: hypothetical protein DRP09_11785 [Candidatus Thorarchaeota archaeon]